MKRYRLPSAVLWIATACVLAAPATPLAAVSTTSPLTTPTSAFVRFRPEFDLIFSNTQGSLTASNGSLAIAPVHLPNGVQVTALVGFLLDQSSSEGARVVLQRRLITTNASFDNEEMGLVDSVGNSSAVQTVRDDTILNPIVDNTRYIYYLYLAGIGPQRSLYGVQVEFTGPPLLVDGFESGNTSAWSGSNP